MKRIWLSKKGENMKQILYIEDHEDTAEAVKTMLSHAGFFVEIALTGKDGIKHALEKNFDIILLDIMLPDMSGWDIFKTLSKKLKGVRYIFLSIIPVSTERMEEFKKAGICDYIMKPFKKEELIVRIKRCI